jgi:hypothetical protein
VGEAMMYDDDAAAEFYSDPDNRKPAGPPRERTGQARRLTSHIPIRFRPQTIAKARVIAERDGMTVSSWIRAVIEREVERRMPTSSETHQSASESGWRVVRSSRVVPEARTQNPEWTPDRAHVAFA